MYCLHVSRGHWVPECGVMDGRLLVTMWCWKLNLDPLQEQEQLWMADPFLQSPFELYSFPVCTVVPVPPCIFIHFLFTLLFGDCRPKIIIEFMLFYIIY